jgi:hypothetical protein
MKKVEFAEADGPGRGNGLENRIGGEQSQPAETYTTTTTAAVEPTSNSTL